MLHMFKHDQNVPQIPYRFHSHDEPHSIPHAIYRHFENDFFFPYNMTWAIALLDVIITTLGFQFKDVINIATICMMFKSRN
jgi:hypothetical protein